jgi:outer membrane protein OmpA-like peptidoglycan-associated protein
MSGLSLLLRSVGVAGLVLALSACQTPPPAPAPYSGPVLPIEQSERGVQIFLPNSVLFEVGKSALSLKDSGPYLDRVADLLKNKTKNAVSLEGHADSTGSATLNQSLSEDRARAVAVALTERGVPKERLQTAGFSFNRPVASNTTEDGRKLNRRVEVVILDEKVENITKGESPNAFSSAWAQLKSLIDQGLVKPAEK